MGKLIIECDVGNVSDGYHTFNELYTHRCLLFIALMNAHPDISWKSKKHADGTEYDGWFIAGMQLPTGDISYHIPIESMWDKTKDIKELELGLEWDGHTSDDVILRLNEWLGSV